VERIEKSQLNMLVASDTIPLHPEAAQCEKIRIVPSYRLFSTAIRNIHNEDSISTLFQILH
jgi:ribose-phosphate pyrophosphokinase